MRQDRSNQPGGTWADRFGAVASSLCALHCAVCALAPALLGALGLGFLLTHEAELGLTLMAVTFAASALLLGWRQHRSTLIIGLLAVGIIGLLASRGLEMGAGHHEHHAPPGHTEMKHPEEAHSGLVHAPREHTGDHVDEHAAAGASHSEGLHSIGAAVGVLAGLLLLVGHVLNIRTARQRDEAYSA